MLKTAILVFVVSNTINQRFSISLNPSKKILHQDRQKRQLFWSGSNIVKSSLGVSFPVETRDVVNFRTLNMGYSLQAQYILVPPGNHQWTKFERSLRNQQHRNENSEVDETRQAFYNAVDILMMRKGINGKECIQRAICENAQSPIEVTGIFHEILNLILTPKKNDADRNYIDARNAGVIGADCSKVYENCPMEFVLKYLYYN